VEYVVDKVKIDYIFLGLPKLFLEIILSSASLSVVLVQVNSTFLIFADE